MTDEDPLTSTLRPATDAIITVRVIKSFEYRTERNLVLRDIDLKHTTAGQLLELVKKDISTQGAYRPLRNVLYDTLKLYTKAHGTKSQNLIINLDDDDTLMLLDLDKSLSDYGVENETELSCFNRELYEKYKAHPVEKW
ncbi:uncharacterized protein V1516DRAFT_679317 [Lipomyces oligophaga]|uniref:uncharacterized protein n=1 Tax=Lipomyces oligophaga TaxID=45792 RepID=UPI0034CF3F1A